MTKSKAKTQYFINIQVPRFVEITLIASDILKGSISQLETCAIARAIKRTLGDNPSVTSSECTIEAWGGEAKLALPKKAQQFIKKFDHCYSLADKKKLKPISFVAKVVAYSNSDISIQ
jgi:hypothetical protein